MGLSYHKTSNLISFKIIKYNKHINQFKNKIKSTKLSKISFDYYKFNNLKIFFVFSIET
jgi:hypothetical protein